MFSRHMASIPIYLHPSSIAKGDARPFFGKKTLRFCESCLRILLLEKRAIIVGSSLFYASVDEVWALFLLISSVLYPLGVKQYISKKKL